LAGREGEDLDASVRRADPERWLTSRFVADRAAREDLIALYAFDHELARASRAAREPLVQEMRLAWWREALDEIAAGRPVRAHPVARALERAVRRRQLAPAELEAMIDGHLIALGSGALALPEALGFADLAEGAAVRLAVRILDAAAPADDAAPAGRAWGLALLLRARRARREALAGPLAEALAAARSGARRLGIAAFPAVLPARLARFDLAGRTPGPLAKRASLTAAALSGRV